MAAQKKTIMNRTAFFYWKLKPITYFFMPVLDFNKNLIPVIMPLIHTHRKPVMKIGIPKEIHQGEMRVATTPEPPHKL